ncbi:hypothetical protein [Enhydrobacter sp.]|jgi:anti-sigma factor RsiW|uniref:hypothetical protein n=1 Tax=Enhydrobacter sp. TaxID=1894999 RepID=UPI002633BA6A|nr:hypothetical protein [Enhydrobacter sp.]WIM13533.1 MAG: hypothetical protein OJF58_004501 [Enhydrobacter sp.]
MRREALLGVALAFLLTSCNQPGAEDARARNPEKYDKDRSLCAAQVDEDTKARRRVDASRRDIFQDERNRYGQGALPQAMDNYSDAKSTDRLIANCMEARGWPKPSQQWWQRLWR